MQSKNSIKNKKKIIVIGASGFIGKNIVKELIEKNYYVISLDKKNFKIQSTNHKFYKSTIKKFFKKKLVIKNLHSIIHLAEDARNNFYQIKPELALENIDNVFCILNYIKGLKKKPLFIYSSSKQIELDALSKSTNPYSMSKKFNEDIISFYSKKIGIKYFVVRFTDVFSLKNNPKEKALKILISRIKKNQNIYVDNVNHNFEYVSIKSITTGIIKILKNRINQQHINFYGNQINIIDLLKKIKKILNSNSKIIIKKKNKKFLFSKIKILKYKLTKNDNFNYKLKLIIRNETQ